jgi:ribose-phosphate pyrophosphokinase
MILLSGQSTPKLAHEVAAMLQVELGEVEFGQFPNGEQRLRIVTPLVDENVVIMQSFHNPVDTHLMELLLLIDAADRAGARKISVAIPWMGYSLQDKVFRGGEPLSAKVVANLISSQRVNRVFLFDLHNISIVGFFSVPTRMISAHDLFVEYARTTFESPVIVSPDFGGLKRARGFAEALNAPLATIEKSRDYTTGEVTMHSVDGDDVRGKICVMYDDIISTGSTVMAGAAFLKKAGAKEVHMLSTHGLFAGDALEKLAGSAIDSVVVTNSIERSEHSKVRVISAAAPIAAELNALYHPNQ